MKDAIVTGDTEDAVLALLIDLTASSSIEGRPLFPNPLQEPIFFRRYFKRWVREGFEELKKSQAKPES